jgi:tRNA A-37 threonylcarbamoyl transferase component Bud32
MGELSQSLWSSVPVQFFVLAAQAEAPAAGSPSWGMLMLFLVGFVMLLLIAGGVGLALLVRRRGAAAAPVAGRSVVSVLPAHAMRPFATAPALAQSRNCPQCGDVLAPGVPEGLCPRCLLRCGLGQAEPEPVVPDGAFTAAYQPTGGVPSVAQLSPLFPQLDILDLIGQGGMGAVYKARQTKLDRLVALKILPQTAHADPAFAERFTREARAMARLSHPNIVTVHDFGEVNGLYYLIMEFVEGPNLRQVLQASKLAPDEALKVVPQICDALQYAHEQGIVHRDVKPENILFDKRGQVKIADFGLAKLLGRDGKAFTLTGTQQVMGTPHYMAPEQVDRPLEVDHRADIYSLGVVFYEMLTGELPLGRFPPPSRKVPVDGRFDEVVLRALERDPDHRYQHISEIKTAAESLRGPGGAAAIPANREGLNVFVTQFEDWSGIRTDLNTLSLDLLALVGVAAAIALLGWGIWLTKSGWFVFGIPALAKLARHIPLSSWARMVLAFLFILSMVALWVLMVRMDWWNWWWGMVIIAAWIAYDDIKSFFESSLRGGRSKSVEAVNQSAAEQEALASLTPQEQELFRILKRHQTEYCFYLIPEIPGEALHAARKKSGAPPTDRILAYLDLTADEEGKYNLLVGSGGVYFYDAEKFALAMPFEEFPDRVFVNHGKAVYLGKDQYFTPDLENNDAFDCETIANLLNALRSWVVSRKAAQPGNPPGGTPA